MSETENIKNLYKPNYIQEKKFVRESRRLVSIKNGQLGYKVVFGNRKDIVDCRMKRYEDKVIKMQRRIDFLNRIRSQELLLNKKNAKLSPEYLEKMSELLNKNDKDYVSQRSQLTFRECPNSRRQKKSLSIQIEKRGKEKKESFLTHLLDDYLHTRKNDTSDNTNILNKKKSAEHLSIISPKDEEFGNFDDNNKYNQERIKIRLRKHYQFFKSPSKIKDDFSKMKIKIFQVFEPPSIERRNEVGILLSNRKYIERLKRNKSTTDISNEMSSLPLLNSERSINLRNRKIKVKKVKVKL